MEVQHIVECDGLGVLDVTPWVEGFQLGTRTPGGFWEARVGLLSETWLGYQLYRNWPGGTYTAYGMGRVIWQGYLAGVVRSGEKTELLAHGEVLKLQDIEAWRVYADSAYRHWSPETSDRFDTDNNNRVYVQTQQGPAYVVGDVAGVVYPETGVLPGAATVRIEAVVDVSITGSWTVELRDGVGAVLWSTSTSVVGGVIALSVGGVLGLRWVIRRSGATNGFASARLTQVVVRTLYPTTSDGVFSDVIAAAGITAYDVRSTGVTMDQAVYQGRERRWDVVRDVAALGDGSEAWVATVYEQGAALRPWATDPGWLLTPDFVKRSGVQQERADIFNAVRVKLPDGWISGWQTDAGSIARYGRRERTLALPQMSQAQATALAQVYLSDHAEALSGISLDVDLWLQQADGSTWPACFVRAGEVVRLRDLVEPFADVDVRVKETLFDGRTMRLVPQGAANRLETMLAAREEG